jgi:hypothetical protein
MDKIEIRGKRYDYEVTLTVLCRCGGTVEVVKVFGARELSGRDEAAAVLHTVPYCAAMDDLEPDALLRWIRTGRYPGEAN